MRQFGKYTKFIEELVSKLNNDEAIFLVGDLNRVMRKLKEEGVNDLGVEPVYKTIPLNMSFDELNGAYYFSGGERVLSGYKIFKTN